MRMRGRQNMEYIAQLSQNSLAKKIKILDLQHNLDSGRADIPDSLKLRYEKALLYLEDKGGAS